MKHKIHIALSLLMALAMVLALAGCNKSGKETEEPSVYEKNLAFYEEVLSDLPEGSAYALADISESYDALLVTSAPIEFDDNVEAATADVYGRDKDGNLAKLGSVESTSTSMPFMVKDGYVYFGSHHYVSRATIDEKKGKLVIETAEETDDNYDAFLTAYGEGVIIAFTLVK